MIADTFDYVVAGSAAAAHELLHEHDGNSLLLGGGTWVIPELNQGDRRAELVVDLAHAGLDSVTVSDTVIGIGAMCSYADLLDRAEVLRLAPLLQLMASGVTGGPQIRCQATIGGSMAAARAGYDAPTALVALDATVAVLGTTGVRRVAAAELLRGDRQTSLARDEIITSFEITGDVTASSSGYCKLKRSQSSWPIVTAAATITYGGERPSGARVAVGGVATVPVVVTLDGEELTSRELRAMLAARISDGMGAPFADVLAPQEYRAAVAPVAASRALADALAIPGRVR